ncbi:Plasmid stabilization system [Thiocapsa sp. KS1]|jgi:mRNA-degrading endonuclease RelE of RelBE toxin-antitoxin system|nr:Plasmid stabilization system [Thiocapsa sp. KS1]
MDMNTIQWTCKAARQLRKIKEKSARQRIFAEVQLLATFPDCVNVKKLTNHVYSYRLRIDDYRVFFEFDGAVRIVLIEEVKKRNERTY